MQGIVKASELTAAQRDEIRELQETCNQFEDLELFIDLDDPADLQNEMSHLFAYFCDGRLAGVAGLEGSRQIESCILVHPEYRQRGIGSMLLQAVQGECRKRGVDHFLLVCDAAAATSAGFATANDAKYSFSEHRMVLDKKQHTSYASRQSAGQQQIRLEACTAGDIAIFVRVVAQAFGDPEPVLQERYMQELSQPNIRHYIAWLNEEPVGSVRLIGNAEEQYITALGVIPEYRGRGYGRQILDKAINLLLAMNCPHILIEVETENDTALSLYRTCGFITTRTFRYYTVQIASRTPAGVQE